MSQTKTNNKIQTNQHKPVLQQEVLESLSPQKGDRYLDLTAGYGGHAADILDKTESEAVLVDRDQNAINVLRATFAASSEIKTIQQDYLQACKELEQKGEKFDLILVDLGVSSPHLDNADRGFSIALDGPLDMRMDTSQTHTANDVVNTYHADELTRIIREYGEEPKARQIAKAIVDSRPLETTAELAAVAKRAWPGYSRVHPATRLFQAIRIEVNKELDQLERALPVMVQLLNAGGRLGIISFHSLEDRIVKRFFRERAGQGRYDSDLSELTKRPITVSQNELVNNPRSRSAKLRVVVAKNKNKKEGHGQKHANPSKNKLETTKNSG